MNKQKILLEINDLDWLLDGQSSEYYVYKRDVEDIIMSIFDNFENRICKNCIHYDKDDKVCVLLDMGVLNDTFGCKEFKENK